MTDTGVFELFGSLGRIGVDAFQELPKVEVKGIDVGWERNTLDRDFRADMLLMIMVALLPAIPVNSRRWAAEIHPAAVIPDGDRSELV